MQSKEQTYLNYYTILVGLCGYLLPEKLTRNKLVLKEKNIKYKIGKLIPTHQIGTSICALK